jgi:FAD binding domain/HI0933-like protein/TAT (twin-arginine translocation) pathway signal sequence
MARKADTDRKDSKPHGEKSVSRRDFVKTGAVAGVGAAAGVGTTVLSTSGTALSQVSPADAIQWHYEADVVVIGAGCTGLPAAIRARDLGASVIVVDQNFDPGGKMLHSGAQVSFGGGDPLQLRDIAGETDKEGFVTAPRQHTVAELTEDADFLFRDHTDWSVMDAAAQAPYRYNERELHRAYADNCYATREFLMANYVRMGRISGTHGNGGLSRARRAVCFLMEGATTDIKKGIVSTQDAGVEGARSSHFAPRPMGDAAKVASSGARSNGAALARPLEFSAREKGVQFILNRHMDEIIREQQFSGRVLGIRASYSPRLDPETGARLESLWQNGNIDDRRETIFIRARKAIVIGAGGHGANPQFRSMFYPAWREPAFVSSGWALLGPRGQDASGIIAGMRVGANLAGMQQNLSYANTFHIPGILATRDSYTDMFPGHPTFSLRGSTGINLPNDSFQHLIVVNQVGKRFFNEMLITDRKGGAAFPGGPARGQPKSGLNHVQLDWRNASVENIRATYAEPNSIHAALAMNDGSKAPDFFSGPIWAIFDRAAVERDKWKIDPPFTSSTNGFFFKADTIEELAARIKAGHEFQRVPLTYLAETVAKWNSYVDKGSDPEFARGSDAPMYKIDRPPFYAATLYPVWHDSYGGLRINGRAQVIDMQGEPIPGLYAGGESSGGGNQHGLGRALVHGYIAGTNAAKETTT